MTTSNFLFSKLFSENEKSKYLYSNYNFENASPETLNLLKRISIISKYKSYLKNFLTKKKISIKDKGRYIGQYKAGLTYPEMVDVNLISEIGEDSILNVSYLIGALNILFIGFNMSRKPIDSSLWKETMVGFLVSVIAGYGLHKYNMKGCPERLDKIYFDLEKRMNNFPELKYQKTNEDMFTEDSFDHDADADNKY